MIALLSIAVFFLVYVTGSLVTPRMYREEIARRNLEGKLEETKRYSYLQWVECRTPEKCDHTDHRINSNRFNNEFLLVSMFWPIWAVYFPWVEFSKSSYQAIDVYKFESHDTKMARLDAELESMRKELEAMNAPKVPGPVRAKRNQGDSRLSRQPESNLDDQAEFEQAWKTIIEAKKIKNVIPLRR